MTTLASTFGYKMAWIAIKNTTPEEIIRKIQLSDVQIIDWSAGIMKVYEYHGRSNNTILLSPQIRGWTFMVGWYLCDLNKPDGKLEWLKGWMEKLSTSFEEVQAFATHRVSEYHHWVLAKNGKIDRCFAYGDGVIYNEGKLTDVEKQFPWDKLETFKWFPNERDVLLVAENWSVNPQTMTSSDIKDKTYYIANIS